MEKGKFGKIILSEKEEAWFRRHYKHTKDKDIAERFGISIRSVSRLARKMELRKSWQFMQKCYEENAAYANALHRINGTYPPKGYQIPRGEEFRFKKGVTNLERLGAKRNAERIAKNAEARRKTYKLEKARVLFGLPQQTKLQVVRRPEWQIKMRYNLKQRGYIIERGGFIAYYDDNTKRNMALETRPRTGFTFKQI